MVLSHRLDETRRPREFFSLVEVIFGNVEEGKIRNDDIKRTANVSCFGKAREAGFGFPELSRGGTVITLVEEY